MQIGCVYIEYIMSQYVNFYDFILNLPFNKQRQAVDYRVSCHDDLKLVLSNFPMLINIDLAKYKKR